MVDRRVEVVARLKALEEAAAPLVAFLQNPNALKELRADKQHNLKLLNDRYQIESQQGTISDRVLAEKLNMNYDDAERWIVNLIRTSKLDAKIDSKSGTVIMEPTHPNVYEQLIDHTKALSGHTYKLVGQFTSASIFSSTSINMVPSGLQDS